MFVYDPDDPDSAARYNPDMDTWSCSECGRVYWKLNHTGKEW